MKGSLRLSLTVLYGLLLLAAPCHSFAAAATVNQLEGLELVRKGFAAISDFTAEITQEKQIALLKRTMTSSGMVRFKRPDLFYMEVYSPYPSRLLMKDNVMTMVLPAEGVKQKSVLPRDGGLGHWLSLLERPLASIPKGMEIRSERSNGLVTTRVSPGGKKGVREIIITLLEDGRPKRLVIEEQNGDRTSILFRRVRKNIGLTEDDFRIE